MHLKTILQIVLPLALFLTSILTAASDIPDVEKQVLREFAASQHLDQMWPQLIDKITSDSTPRLLEYTKK